MNFTYRDMLILLSMTVAVILMSFTFTALGLANEDVQENDIPEFNTTAENFNMVDEFPDNPGTPSQFTITWNELLSGSSDNQYWLHGDTNGGVEAALFNDGNASNPEPRIRINDWNSGSVNSYKEYNFSEEGNYSVITEGNYTLYIEWDETKNLGENDMSFGVLVQIREQPSDKGFLGRIPVVGAVFSAGQELASIVAYIGVVIWWISATILEITINLILTLYGVIVFFVSMIHWLLITYTAIITGVSAWASVFLAIPGTLLMLEFTKLLLIGIKLLPTT